MIVGIELLVSDQIEIPLSQSRLTHKDQVLSQKVPVQGDTS